MYRSEMTELEDRISTLIALAIVVIVAVLVLNYYSKSEDHVNPCQAYEELKMEEVPAKCVGYFN